MSTNDTLAQQSNGTVPKSKIVAMLMGDRTDAEKVAKDLIRALGNTLKFEYQDGTCRLTCPDQISHGIQERLRVAQKERGNRPNIRIAVF